MTQTHTVGDGGGIDPETIEELERRRDENAEKADRYEDSEPEKAAWFRGIKTGYEGALEVLRGDE